MLAKERCKLFLTLIQGVGGGGGGGGGEKFKLQNMK